MSDTTAASPRDVRELADELGALASAVPGVARIQARPGVGRLARRVLQNLTAVVGAPASPTGGAEVALTVTADSTLVELDVALDGEVPGPVVAREVARTLLDRLALEGELPSASVDVRIVSIP